MRVRLGQSVQFVPILRVPVMERRRETGGERERERDEERWSESERQQERKLKQGLRVWYHFVIENVKFFCLT